MMEHYDEYVRDFSASDSGLPFNAKFRYRNFQVKLDVDMIRCHYEHQEIS